jgi:ubiquinone/menaquinone biosynthesis C-methylase UbiE
MTDPASSDISRESLFRLMQAYKSTSLLRAGIELGVFDLLTDRTTAASVALGIGADPRGTRILLNALAALHLAQADGEYFWLSPGVEKLLVRAHPEYVGDMVHVFASDWEWDALKRLSAAVCKGGTVMPEHAETPEYKYWEDFAAYAPIVAKPTAEVLAAALDGWADDRPSLDVLDLACGHGIYGFTVARQYPQAAVWSLDWPNVLRLTEKHAVRLGVRDRTEFIAGDMFEAPLGGPYDLVLITNVLHHFSTERATQLLARAASVLKPGGRVGIVGFTTTDAPPAEDPAPHLFSVLMLVWTFDGEVHSAQAYHQMLATTGFTGVQTHTVPRLPFRVLLADRR